MTAGKILVVDDHVDLAENIAEILNGVGYETVIAESAEAALEQVSAGGIVALVTDYRLPGKSGAELIAELRRRGSEIPALVMSAYTDDDTIETAERAGAFQVLAKPVNIPLLTKIMDELGKPSAVVLIVDDNRALGENFAEALRGRGYEAILGTTAADALAHRVRSRIAIIDFRLPDSNGVDVADRLRARDPQTRVLYVSAHSDELRDRLQGRSEQSDVMDKPVDVAQLLAWVARAMGNGDGQTPRSHR